MFLDNHFDDRQAHTRSFVLTRTVEPFEQTEDLYVAEGYSRETVINNMILQLLLKNGYLSVTDLARGRIAEKVNRETIASAKFAVMQRMG